MAQHHRSGRRRLGLLLCGVSFLACAAMMATVLIAYGTPYNPIWWLVMGGILAGAGLGPLLLLAPIEWVAAGYRQDWAAAAAPGEGEGGEAG